MEWKIRDVEIPNQTVLGPMAGVTDLPFRLLCKEQGAGLVVMEMVSAKALTYHNARTQELLRTDSREAPVSVQLFGHEPEVMAQAVQLLEAQAGPAGAESGLITTQTGPSGWATTQAAVAGMESGSPKVQNGQGSGEASDASVTQNAGDGSDAEVAGRALSQEDVKAQGAARFDFLDINMGCPMPKIVNNQEGSALMKDPALIERIVRACVENTTRPVTVKMRTGWDCDHINAVECAKAAEAGGASMVAVHGRTRTQMYAGTADWLVIREVVRAVRIPVVGNGDVKDGPSARRLLDETGAAAVMIGRAAQGNPWIFHEINHYLETGEALARPSRREIIRMLLRHAELMRQIKGERIGIQEMRSHAAWYLQGFPGASKLRAQINTVHSFDELEELLHREFPYA